MKDVRIGIVTGSRADWGLLSPVYRALGKQPNCTPRLFVTGMHLLPAFGSSWKTVDVPIAARVSMYPGDPSDTARGARGLSKAFEKEKLDALIILGDRKEMLAGALAAFDLGIPIAHIHGGDATESGHQDETIRPILSLLSDLHFPASTRSKERLIALGIDPKTITISGSPALDAVRIHALAPEKEVRKKLDIEGPYAVLSFHSHDRAINMGDVHLRAILAALKHEKHELVIIYPNNDAGNERIIAEIKKLANKKGIRIFKTMPQPFFLDVLRSAEFLIGNSSGAIYECSYMEVPAINVGDRNRGREHGANVIDVPPDTHKIRAAIKKISAPSFKKNMHADKHIFGNGNAAEIIAKNVMAIARANSRKHG